MVNNMDYIKMKYISQESQTSSIDVDHFLLLEKWLQLGCADISTIKDTG